MSKHKLTSLAEEDLIEIWQYIAEDNSDAADGMLDYLHAQCNAIAKNPHFGKLREDLAKNLFVSVAGKSSWRSQYLICYRIQKYGIEVDRILEGHQDINQNFFD